MDGAVSITIVKWYCSQASYVSDGFYVPDKRVCLQLINGHLWETVLHPYKRRKKTATALHAQCSYVMLDIIFM